MTGDIFAQYIRTLGRGPTKSRHLTAEEAEIAFGGVLSGEMSDMQVGALLLLLRYRGENPAELAGIVRAMRAHAGMGDQLPFQDIIDWPSYSSGQSRRLPWFLLSAKLLAENGFKVFMHGFNSHLDNGLLTEECLKAVDEVAASSLTDAKDKLKQQNFVYLPLRNFAPKLLDLLQVRSVLGVRSIVNTAVKLINPVAARTIFLGIFHPPYIQLNMGAAALLQQPCLGVIKGGGGEAERNILKPIKLFQLDKGEEQATSWPAYELESCSQGIRDYPVTVDYLSDIWHGRVKDEYAVKMILGTTAQALYLMGKTVSVEQAEGIAQDYWDQHMEKR